MSTLHAGRRVQLRRGLQTVQARHLDVQHGHVRLRHAGCPDDLVAPSHGGDDLDVGLQAQQGRQGIAHRGLILGQQHPNHGWTADARAFS